MSKESKRAKEKNFKSLPFDGLEDFLSLVIDNLKANIALLSSEGNILAVNEGWKEFAESEGLNLKDYGVGVNYLEISRASEGEDALLAEEAAAGIEEVLEGERDSFTLEYPCHGLDKKRWFLMEASSIHYNGTTYGLVSHKNITERKKSELEKEYRESKYRRVVENSIMGVAITDLGNNHKYVNSYYADMLGYSKEELEGKNLEEIAPEGEVEELKMRTSIREQDEAEIYESQLLKKDGTPIDILISATPQKNKEGEVVGTIGFVQNITERKRAEEREEFLHSLLRHDVGNKMNIIDGYLQLLMSDFDLPEEAEKYVKKTKKANDEAQNLIEKVKILRNAQNEEVGSIELKSLIEGSMERCKTIADENDMKIKIDRSSLEQKIEGGQLLKEAFSNVIENAIRHSEGDEVRISAKSIDGHINCIIEDDGKGIPEDEKEKIFERGYSKGIDKGGGLGLFLVRMILKMYDANIHVEDSEYGGAKFLIKLRKSDS